MMIKLRPHVAFAGLAGLTFLTGCISVLPETQPPSYLVRMSVLQAASPGLLETRVLINEPDATGALAGAEVAATRDGGLVYINDVRWADAPSRMLQSALVDALSRAEGEGWAESVESGARGDFELRWTIRDLSYDMQARRGVCDLRVSLLTVRTRDVVASQRIRTEAPSETMRDAARADAIAAAMAQAAAQAAKFVVAHATEENRPPARRPRLERREAAPPPPADETETPPDPVQDISDASTSL